MVALLAGASAWAGCAQSKAKAVVPPPALHVPAAPPRVIDPLPEPVVAEPEPEPEPAPPPATKPVRTSRGTRPAEPAKAEPEPEPVPAPGHPPAALRTPSTGDPAETERRVTDTIERTRRLLERVRPSALDRETRQQFENAKRFASQAEGALRARNYLFATYLADKAEALAKELAGR